MVDFSIFQRNQFGSLSNRFVHSFNQGRELVVVQDGFVRISYGYDQYKSIKYSLNPINNSDLNQIGTLLALYNDTEIEILSLTDDHIYRIYVPHGIKQIVWHPLSYLNSSLVVLTQKNTINIYELVEKQYNNPTIILNKPINQLGLGSRIEKISKIQISSNGFTLYLLSLQDGGDIFSIYPFLCKHLAKINSTQLLNKSLVLYESITHNTPTWKKKNLIKQLKFVSQLEKNQINDSERCGSIQGPFIITLFPEKLYESVANDMIIYPMKNNHMDDLILINFDNGSNLVTFMDLEPIMSWDNNESTENSLIILDTFNGEGRLFKKNNFVILLSDQTRIVSLPWLPKFKDCIESGNMNELSLINFESEYTDIHDKFGTVVSFSRKSHIILLLISNDKFVTFKKGNTDIEPNTITQPICPYKSVLTSNQELNNLYSSLKLELTKPVSLVPPEIRNLSIDNENNEIQLDFLTDIAKEMMSKIILSQTLVLYIHEKLKEQKFDFDNQLFNFSKNFALINGFKHQNGVLKERFDKIKTKQALLDQRLESLEDKLYRIEKLERYKKFELNSAELKWFKELKNQVNKFNEMVIHQSKSKEELHFLIKELEISKNKSENDFIQFDVLQKLLLEDSKLIEKCNNELNGISEQLENNL